MLTVPGFGHGTHQMAVTLLGMQSCEKSRTEIYMIFSPPFLVAFVVQIERVSWTGYPLHTKRGLATRGKAFGDGDGVVVMRLSINISFLWPQDGKRSLATRAENKGVIGWLLLPFPSLSLPLALFLSLFSLALAVDFASFRLLLTPHIVYFILFLSFLL